jgi:hypothetical protein
MKNSRSKHTSSNVESSMPLQFSSPKTMFLLGPELPGPLNYVRSMAGRRSRNVIFSDSGAGVDVGGPCLGHSRVASGGATEFPGEAGALATPPQKCQFIP